MTIQSCIYDIYLNLIPIPSILYPNMCKAAVCEHDEPATNPEQANGCIRGWVVGGGGGGNKLEQANQGLQAEFVCDKTWISKRSLASICMSVSRSMFMIYMCIYIYISLSLSLSPILKLPPPGTRPVGFRGLELRV